MILGNYGLCWWIVVIPKILICLWNNPSLNKVGSLLTNTLNCIYATTQIKGSCNCDLL